MILSYTDLEEIAEAVIRDFNKFLYGNETRIRRNVPRATQIERMARDYLGLRVSFADLSADGSICGLTAYADTEYQIVTDGVPHKIPLSRNQVLLDSSFIRPGQKKKQRGKYRFTLAHECAHQILFQMESDANKSSCERRYAEGANYSLRDLKTHEDWNEWQANILAAALLMPQKEVVLAMSSFRQSDRLKNYGGAMPYVDRMILSAFCQCLGVSKSAAFIRLQQLGYIEEHPRDAFYDPFEVWA